MPQMAITPEERERRKSRNRKIVVGFFTLIGVIVVLESPLLRIRHLEVSGNTTIQASRMIAESGLRTGQSLWQVNERSVSNQILSAEPMAQSIHLQTSWLQGTVHILVQERHVVAIYESAGLFYELLNNGFAYREVAASNGLPFPVITANGGTAKVGQIVSPEIAVICQQLGKISANALSDVSEFNANGDGTLSMYLDDGFVVTADDSSLVGAVNGMETAVAYFVQKGYKPGLIDLSGQPPYRYTPFGTKKTQSATKGAKG